MQILGHSKCFMFLIINSYNIAKKSIYRSVHTLPLPLNFIRRSRISDNLITLEDKYVLWKDELLRIFSQNITQLNTYIKWRGKEYNDRQRTGSVYKQHLEPTITYDQWNEVHPVLQNDGKFYNRH